MIQFLSQAPPSKRSKKEVRATVVQMLAPQISKELNENGKMDWSSEKPVGRTTLYNDPKGLTVDAHGRLPCQP